MTEAADLMMHELEVKIKAMTADEILQATKKQAKQKISKVSQASKW